MNDQPNTSTREAVASVGSAITAAVAQVTDQPTMRVSCEDHDGKTITTPPFTMDDLEATTETLRGANAQRAVTAAAAQVTDELTAEVANLVIREGKCSSSFVQRKFSIGYNRASRIVEVLEALGVVTAADHVGKREVVLTEVPQDLIRAAAAQKTLERLKASTPLKETSEDKAVSDAAYRVSADELRQFIEHIERLDAEKKDLAEQQKEVMAEAKGRGYDTKIIRKVIALRKREPDDIAEEDAVLEMYKEALGMS